MTDHIQDQMRGQGNGVPRDVESNPTENTLGNIIYIDVRVPMVFIVDTQDFNDEDWIEAVMQMQVEIAHDLGIDPDLTEKIDIEERRPIQVGGRML